ncbi:trichohyalin-like isoform X4 [Pristis pectinata]|uniref:trichohyalin-like isoform X4 n=1 Tax=Pristis pectinata TaxID=685728 RepID=UPI00223CBEE9|nr:trichohyalin-like isoform X4 [Pristis pectinata]
MADHRSPTPKARKFARDARRTARRRKGLPEFQDPEVEEDTQAEKWSSGEKFIMEKVHEFFQECGGGERGFITREDMKKLQQKFPFSSEELEMVFDKLDVDTNGILTPEQLTKGLSHFLSDQKEDAGGAHLKDPPESLYQSQSLQQQVEAEDEEKQQFAALMGKLGAGAIFEDKSEIWKLWIQLRRNEPNLLGHLEDFLSKVTGQIQETLHEKEELERTLKKKMVEHNADVQRLYEEMELQINNEKERIETESVVKFQAQGQDLQKELDSKQDEVQHLVQMQTQLQAELASLLTKQDETTNENQELKLTNQEMTLQLEQLQQELREARDRLVIVQEEAAHREEKRGEWDQSLGKEGPCSEEAVQQLQAELASLRSKQDETSTENQELRATNQELETRLEGIGQELREARDRLEGKRGEWTQTPDSEKLHSEEGDQQLQAELTSLRSKQDETSTENQELRATNQELEMRLEGIQQELQEARDQLVILQQEKEGGRDQPSGSGSADSDEAVQQLQAELASLRSEQDETSTENQELRATNQELETRLKGIQLELREAQDRLVILQEEAAHREEKERESDQSPGSAGLRSEEAFQQFQEELASLRSKQDETSAENQELKVNNQELETRLEGIRQELREARDRLVILQEEAAHREETGGELDRSPDSAGPCSEEAFQQLQAELASLHSKQDETSTENQELKVTNQELETRLEGIRLELREAQDRLVILQEEAAHREEKGGNLDRSPDSAGPCSEETFQQLQAELASLRSKQDETSAENQELRATNQELETRLEGIGQELQEARDRLVILQEEAAHREEKGGELDQTPGTMGPCSEEAIQQLQAELASLRSKQDETSTENQELKATNQELETRLEGIQLELREARDRLVNIPEEKEGGRDQPSGSGSADSDEAVQQLQAELASLRSKQDETSTENQELKVTNQELETRLEGIQLELREARDRLVILQEEAAHQEEKERERSRSLDSERAQADEAVQELQAELTSLRSKQDETSTENQELRATNQELETRLEGIQEELREAQDRLVILQEEAAPREEKEGLQRTRSIRRRAAANTSSKPDTRGVDPGLPHLMVEGQDVTPEGGGDGAHEETAVASARDGAAERIEEVAGPGKQTPSTLQAELASLRSKQDKTSTENQELRATNQELETRLEGIGQELREARDRLVILQQEEEGALDQAASSRRLLSEEAAQQLQAELASLRSKQDETNTENQELKVTNQELETRLKGIQEELREARDRLVILQEEAAHREEKEGVLDQSPGSEGVLSHEAVQQLQAELASLRSKQDETSAENQELKVTNQELETRLEGIQQELQEARDRLVILQEEAAHWEEKEGLQRTRSIRRRAAPDSSSKPDALGEDPGLPHLRVEGQAETLGEGGDGAHEETAAASARDGAAERIEELQAELASLRSKQDETSTENQELKVTNQELETRLEGIQEELREARDRLVILQEEAAHREETEGLHRTRSIRRRAAPDSSSKPDTLGEDPGLRVEGQDVTPGEGGSGSHEASARDGAAERIEELQAELVSLRSKQDETSAENQELRATNQELETRLEGIGQELQEARDRLVILQEEAAHREETEGLQRTRSIRRRAAPDSSSKPDTPGEDSGLPQPRVEGQDVTPGEGGDGVHEETAAASARDRAAEKIEELQAELASLRSKQDETSAENQELKLANQELKAQLTQIQEELQEARDQLVILQEEAAHREKTEGLHRARSIRRRTTRDTSSKPDVTPGEGGDGAHEETAAASARDGAAERIEEAESSKNPDQVYNVMFVGNTNAGKTSFIQHFCDGNFQPGLPSTIGIDYRVKTLKVENRHIALQLWDTAGQERFHSVTKQFFRKADGVIVMYDIASSSSFIEVRYWLSCVKEAASDEVCILLLGNKLDEAAHRQVTRSEGERLAQEYNILFYECSACTGQNIIASMVHLSKSLKQQEERMQGLPVELVKRPERKRKCCT